MSVEHDGLGFDVVDRGPRDGPVVLLLHGFPGGNQTWPQLVGYLASAGYRSVAVEQRGYSARARPSHVDAYRVDSLAEDALSIAAQLSARPVHVIGHDWGALVGWNMAARHPESVASLVALSTPHPAAFAETWMRSSQAVRSLYALWFQLPALPERVLLLGDGAAMRAALRMSGLSEEWADRYVRAMLEPGRLRAAINWYRAAGRSLATNHPTVPDVSVPTTLIWGARDVSVADATMRQTRTHVTAPYRSCVLERCTHWLPELHAAEVWPHVETHLARQENGR